MLLGFHGIKMNAFCEYMKLYGITVSKVLCLKCYRKNLYVLY